MNFSELTRPVQQVLSQHASAILTGVGVTGVVTTAVLAAKGAVKAHHAKNELSAQKYTDGGPSKREEIMVVAPHYVPAVTAGLTTISAIIFGHQVAARNSAALAAAYGLSEKSFKEYKEKVLEKMGEKGEEKVREEIALEKAAKTPTEQIIITGNGDVLMFEEYSGRYFHSNVESVRKAVNNVNHQILHSHYCTLSQFYEELDLPQTQFADTMGWNSENLLEIDLFARRDDYDRPVLVLEYRNPPVPNYGRMY